RRRLRTGRLPRSARRRAQCPYVSALSQGRGRAARSKLARLILVVPAEPERCVGVVFLAPHRCSVEQAVVHHRELEPAGGAYIGAVDGAVRERVRAQAWPLSDVARRVRAARLGILLDDRGYLALQERLQLLLRMHEADIPVEVAAGRRSPVQAPA